MTAKYVNTAIVIVTLNFLFTQSATANPLEELQSQAVIFYGIMILI